MMRRHWTSRIDFGLAFTLLMCGFAVLPILAHPGLFVGHDTLNHAFRVGEVSRLWSEGILLPRWAETFYFGYGSPVFQYYAPLTYTLSVILMRLFSLDALGALRLLVILCLPMAGAGMYLFVRDHAGRLGGILAALVYVYSPYLVFTEPVTRGDYPELLCFALFPLVMWRVEGVLRRGRGRDYLLAALVVAAFSLAHNLMSALLFALLNGWLIWRGLTGNITWAQFRWAWASVLVGIGLTAFFWLPVFLERDAVQLSNVTANIQSEQDNFFGFFVPLERLLSLSPAADAGAANGTLLRLNLGVAGWGLALAGVIGTGVLYRRERTRYIASLQTTVFFGLLTILMLILMLPLAAGLWAGVTALNFLEFPWRLLGPAAFCLALLAGMNALWIERLPARIAGVVTALLVALPVVLALPSLYVPAERLEQLDTSPAGYLGAETDGLTSPGTSARNDFLPRAVKVLPGATQSLLDDYADGGAVNKANPLSIPAGSSVRVVEHRPGADTWAIQAATLFTLETFTFYFAGWTAEIDGQPVSVKVSQPHGFIQIDIPAGEHTVRLFLGETPARGAGAAVSVASVAVLSLIIISIRIRRGVQLNALTASVFIPQLETGNWKLVTLLGGLISLGCVALFMREGIAWVQSPPGEVVIAQERVGYHLGETIQVIGYDLSARTVRPGDWLEVVLYWYVTEPPDYNYTSFVHFSAGEMPLAQADKPLPGGQLTSRWTPGAYRRDEYSLFIPYETISGEYRINLGLYTCDTRPAGDCGNGDRLTVTDERGNPLGDILPLATIQVR